MRTLRPLKCPKDRSKEADPARTLQLRSVQRDTSLCPSIRLPTVVESLSCPVSSKPNEFKLIYQTRPDRPSTVPSRPV